MQPDALKAIRKALNMTQAEFGESMGVSRKLINDLESRDGPIDLRTALAARQLYNEKSRLISSHAVLPKDTDVPLSNAMILWDHEGLADKPPILVVGDPSDNDVEYSSSTGACNSDWLEADDIGRLLRLFAIFIQITVEDGIAPKDVHEAFSVIPEYRFALHRGMFDETEVD